MSEKKPFTGVDDRVRLAEVVPLDTPFTLNIFPSNLCNFRCSYCAQSRGAQSMLQEYGVRCELMSMDVVEHIAEQILQFPGKIKLVSMMGHGEPLCNKNLPAMIKLLKSKAGHKIGRIDVITNASLLTQAYSKALIDAGLDVLRVSLQGITSESYFQTCGVKLDFDEFYQNLAWFYEHKEQCKVYVKTMDVSLKAGTEEKFYQMFSGISDRMFIDKVRPVYDTVGYSEEQSDLSVDRYGNSHAHRKVCPQPFYMLSVWPDGMVTPCDALYHANPLGNVKDSTLVQMWNAPEHKAFCHMQLSGLRDQHLACSRCCAPDDVAHESDVLDDAAATLLDQFSVES